MRTHSYDVQGGQTSIASLRLLVSGFAYREDVQVSTTDTKDLLPREGAGPSIRPHTCGYAHHCIRPLQPCASSEVCLYHLSFHPSSRRIPHLACYALIRWRRRRVPDLCHLQASFDVASRCLIYVFVPSYSSKKQARAIRSILLDSNHCHIKTCSKYNDFK